MTFWHHAFIRCWNVIAVLLILFLGTSQCVGRFFLILLLPFCQHTWFNIGMWIHDFVVLIKTENNERYISAVVSLTLRTRWMEDIAPKQSLQSCKKKKNTETNSNIAKCNVSVSSKNFPCPHLGFPDDCCCLLDWILMAPRWADIWGELLGEGRGETRGDERAVASGGLFCTAGGELIVGCFLGMRLRRWLTQRCCSSWELVSRSSSLAVDMS